MSERAGDLSFLGEREPDFGEIDLERSREPSREPRSLEPREDARGERETDFGDLDLERSFEASREPRASPPSRPLEPRDDPRAERGDALGDLEWGDLERDADLLRERDLATRLDVRLLSR